MSDQPTAPIDNYAKGLTTLAATLHLPRDGGCASFAAHALDTIAVADGLADAVASGDPLRIAHALAKYREARR